MKKYIMAILIWIMIIPLAILNGGFREYILVKLGILARPLSGIILSVCIFVAAYFLVLKIKNCIKRDYIIFGVIWFVLTNLFDLVDCGFNSIVCSGCCNENKKQKVEAGSIEYMLFLCCETSHPYFCSSNK